MSEIKKLYGYQGPNPFVGINGRDFSDEAIQEEFCPTTQFWSLFNSQHEFLIGTRGCGKTFLLKTMRRSMLQRINAPQATDIISQNKYIAFYIALRIERMANIEHTNRPDDEKRALFRFVFNSCLAIAIISEAKKHCDELKTINKQQALLSNSDLADRLYKLWFNYKINETIIDLDDLSALIESVYFNFNFQTDSIDSIPRLFASDLCAPLTSANTVLSSFWNAEEPTWILAVDEAEFVNEPYQKIINSFMRSNPMHIVLKIATLPYYWSTLETLNKDIEISNGNDFNYKLVDMDCDSEDYKRLTNKLCSNRLKRLDFGQKTINANSLEVFLGTVGNDNRIDYFRNEMGTITDEEIREGILASLSKEQQKSIASRRNPAQTVYKKLAPIYYVREVFNKKKGNYIPKWFAGSEVIRKVSQGNPRMFLNLMMQLFSAATSRKDFDLKDQSRVVSKFAHDFCESSKAIEKDGDAIYRNLTLIAQQLHDKTHKTSLNEVGCSFVFTMDVSIEKEKEWIKRAISFSRLSVDETAIQNGISNKTKYVICNAFAVEHWITMRNDYPVKVSLTQKNSAQNSQLSLFEE